MARLHIASDHAGFAYKQYLIEKLAESHEITDHGTDTDESTDYPDYIHRMIESLLEEDGKSMGIAICGSGNGVSMTANKYSNIRAALCWTKEIAQLARAHNDANVLSLPARFISMEQALDIVKKFMNTSFEGGRHARRVDKIACTPK